jgi:Flp pilus assembly protein TadG
MVEFALVLPVLLVVLIGVLQFALMYHAQNVTTTAAQEGARVAAAQGGDLASGEVRAQDVLRSGLGTTGESFAITASDTGEAVVMAASGNYPLIFPWVGSRKVAIHASATMLKEGFRGGP